MDPVIRRGDKLKDLAQSEFSLLHLQPIYNQWNKVPTGIMLSGWEIAKGVFFGKTYHAFSEIFGCDLENFFSRGAVFL